MKHFVLSRAKKKKFRVFVCLFVFITSGLHPASEQDQTGNIITSPRTQIHFFLFSHYFMVYYPLSQGVPLQDR